MISGKKLKRKFSMKTYAEFRRVEMRNKQNRRLSQLMEDYEKLKERLDAEVQAIIENPEEEGMRVDAGIDIEEKEELEEN